MSFSWIYCFLCEGKGKLNIGENYNTFFTEKSIDCPLCKGQGRLAVRVNINKFPWNKDGRNSL